MVAFDKRYKGEGEQFFCAYASRRDNHTYKHSYQEVLAKYGANMSMNERMPAVLADALGDHAFIARFSSQKEIQEFFTFVTE